MSPGAAGESEHRGSGDLAASVGGGRQPSSPRAKAAAAAPPSRVAVAPSSSRTYNGGAGKAAPSSVWTGPP